MNASRTLLLVISLHLSLLLPSLAASHAGAADTPSGTPLYTFAVVPYYTPEKIWQLFSPFVDFLSKKTGRPWELKLYSNHDEFIEDICNGTISVALTGPVPLGRVYNKCGAHPILVALAKNGKPDYHSVVVTSNPDIKGMTDLKGRKFGIFKGSTAAHILPVKMLMNSGLRLSDLQPVYYESQDRIVTALLSGEIDAAGMKETLYLKTGKDRFRVLAASESLPNFALTALPSLPAKLRAQLVSTLTRLKPLKNRGDAATVTPWDDEIKNGFVTPDASFLPSVINLYSVYWEVINESR